MAGMAAQKLETEQIYHLKTDDSGIANPSAKDKKVEGAMTGPILHQGKLYGSFEI